MMRFAFAGSLVLLTTIAAAQQVAETRTYVLSDDSTFQRGCFPPCMCPIMQEVPLTGTFNLAFMGFDPLFANYDVTDVKWAADLGSGELDISGQGTYRIGGEFALVHQLALDLAVGQEPMALYDSGTLAGGSEFPAIVIDISLHGGFCLDTVMRVRAKPTLTVKATEAVLGWEKLAATYDVVAGDLRVLRDSHGNFTVATQSCLTDDSSAATVEHGAVPDPGEGFWYLVRADGPSVSSTYDSGYPSQVEPRDASIAASPTACPP